MTTDITTTITPSPAEETSLVALVARLSCDERVDADKMERLFNLQLKHAAVVAEGAFNAAMSACQREMPQVVKNTKGENGKYANLEEIDRTARPVYSKHGFSLSFGGDEIKDGMVTVHCRLSHCADGATVGHSVDYKLSGAIDTSGPKGGATKTGIQGMGSTSSYLRRYLTCMIFNIAVANEDNDGRSAPKLISPGQRTALLNALGSEERIAKFCAHYKLADVGEIGADQFDLAMAKAKGGAAKQSA